ncbi:hypothetical protein SAPIO_CDS8728 [Scedosporium apiospermum]|uniref:Thiamine pyrophosphate enzyme TPP-binding domain-containing protein n=1 Tax=Pseudallescheria apiosperma TaxID=563466 RepID=A0A084FYU1_PSEDA|nr:uncharacterized protein SAPIO_CDS8728 [Scedosporium apiospermum]KEZ40253.1 hypothetical protein SAPIO_CDS8728 [Scedosporium apiospermum]
MSTSNTGIRPIDRVALTPSAVDTIAQALIHASEPLVVTDFTGKDIRAQAELVKLATAVKGLRVFGAGGSEMSFPSAATEPTAEGYFGAEHLISQVRKAVPEDSLFMIEAVTDTQLVVEKIQETLPAELLATDYIGAKKFVRQIVGDETYLFSFPGSVYWIAKRYNIPILTIVLNNNGWNAPQNSLLPVRPDGPASRVSNKALNISFTPTTDYSGIAKVAGAGKIGTFRASTADELVKTLEYAVEFLKENLCNFGCTFGRPRRKHVD